MSLLGTFQPLERVFTDQEVVDFLELAKVFDEDTAPCQSFPDAWFEEDDPQLTELAKAICADCPAKALCAEYGFKYSDHGIWGGTTARERRALRKRFETGSQVCARLGCRKARVIQGLCSKHHKELESIGQRAEKLFTAR